MSLIKKTLKMSKVMPFSLGETSKSLSENSLHRHRTKGKLLYKREHLHWWGDFGAWTRCGEH